MYIYSEWDSCSMDADSDFNVWRGFKLGSQEEMLTALHAWQCKHQLDDPVETDDRSEFYWVVYEGNWVLHGHYDVANFFFKKV